MKKLLIVGGVVVLLVIVIAAAGSGTDNGGTDGENSADSADAGKEATTATLGQSARDGQFEFTVKSISCGKKTIGGEFLNEKAQGHFCELKVDVENIGDQAQTLFTGDQYLYNADDQQYSADSEANILSDVGGADLFLEEINPGNKVSGIIYFDVPVAAKIVRAELHDSAFSGGVEVNLE